MTDKSKLLNSISISGSQRSQYTSYFKVTLSANQSVVADTAAQLVLFDTIVKDINSDFNTSTSIFVAPYSGIYIFTASIFVENTAASSTVRTSLRLNGTAIATNPQVFITAGASTYQNVPIITMIELAKDDEISCHLTNSDGTYTILKEVTALFTTKTFFSGALVYAQQ